MSIIKEKSRTISKKTLQMMDASMKNFAKGIVGDPIDLKDLKKSIKVKSHDARHKSKS